MKNCLYSIKDVKVGYSANLFTAPNNASAIRMFADSCKDENTLLFKHPEDYELFFVGEFNDENGEIKSEVKFLDSAISYSNNKA